MARAVRERRPSHKSALGLAWGSGWAGGHWTQSAHLVHDRRPDRRPRRADQAVGPFQVGSRTGVGRLGVGRPVQSKIAVRSVNPRQAALADGTQRPTSPSEPGMIRSRGSAPVSAASLTPIDQLTCLQHSRLAPAQSFLLCDWGLSGPTGPDPALPSSGSLSGDSGPNPRGAFAARAYPAALVCRRIWNGEAASLSQVGECT